MWYSLSISGDNMQKFKGIVAARCEVNWPFVCLDGVWMLHAAHNFRKSFLDILNTDWDAPLNTRFWSAVCEFILWVELSLLISDSCIAAVPFGTTDVLGTSFLVDRLPCIAFLISNDFASFGVQGVLTELIKFHMQERGNDFFHELKQYFLTIFSQPEKRFPCLFDNRWFQVLLVASTNISPLRESNFELLKFFWHVDPLAGKAWKRH